MLMSMSLNSDNYKPKVVIDFKERNKPDLTLVILECKKWSLIVVISTHLLNELINKNWFLMLISFISLS